MLSISQLAQDSNVRSQTSVTDIIGSIINSSMRILETRYGNQATTPSGTIVTVPTSDTGTGFKIGGGVIALLIISLAFVYFFFIRK